MCDLNDEDVSTIWEVRRVRARKSYRCETCCAPIHAGEAYARIFSLFEGQASDQTVCVPCQDDNEEFGKAHGYSPNPSAFYSYLSECIRDEGERWAPMLERLNTRLTAAKEATR